MDAPTFLPQSKERPTFYAIIPAFVRYSNVSANAKLMYGEITALCEKEGFCWAKNEYFSSLYDVDERTIRRWLTELVKAGFASVDLAENQYGQRRIFLIDARTKMSAQPGQICPQSPDKNVPHINTRDNDTRDKPPTPKGEPDGFEEIWKAKWSRGTQHHIRARALKAYAASLKRGHKPEDLLVAVKACAGVSKPGSEYAPMLSTWLNEDRWKDAGGAAVVSAAELEASRQRREDAQRDFERRIQDAQEQRRRDMGFTS